MACEIASNKKETCFKIGAGFFVIKNGIETFNRLKDGNMLELGMYRYIIVVKNNIFYDE